MHGGARGRTCLTVPSSCSAIHHLFVLGKMATVLSPLLSVEGLVDPKIERNRARRQTSSLGCLSKEGPWPSLNDLLRGSYGFESLFWKAFQIRHILKSMPPPQNFRQEFTPFERRCSPGGNAKHKLGRIYKWILASSLNENNLPKFIQKWAEDLNLVASLELMVQLSKRVHGSSSSISYRYDEYRTFQQE